MHGAVPGEVVQFIDLNLLTFTFLFFVGLVGGLVSGFIGSGGAFVLTPGMMSLGVPGTVAVASNMCHKFPKALVGAIKRFRYNQVDVKLGVILGASAEVGVQIGIGFQKYILDTFGPAGSDLYVSLMFVAVLVIVGGIVFRDAMNIRRSGGEEKATSLSKKIQSIELWPMITFKRSGIRVSLWFTVPLGLATGLLAATIAVGGFVGVPGMIYLLGVASIMASGTELVIAFVMGLGGSAIWAYYGLVDIRLTLIILSGSLLGVQLGAIGTTYVKEYMIKVVMATIMLIVAVSRGLAIPKYLTKLGVMSLGDTTVSILTTISFGIMLLALVIGAGIILKSIFTGLRQERAQADAAATGQEA
ncbi:sulfite exporter TauE/SafE family protein [Desulfocurvibacter africanus]|uniref:sulfite exporter TauE/SafE family protein n=1 Tax=Desulfocurvibacter africanus TaxID=873 RepID=UPI000400FA39|nr:sulfite exporter TauE/SafE family protein [Desulfocurvibacter africanus]